MSEIVSELTAAYDKVKEWPENSETGFMDLLVLRNLVPEAISELDRLREALEEIVKPVEFMRRRADAAGSKLDGFMAITLAKDPEYLRGIARAALSPDNSTQKKEG